MLVDLKGWNDLVELDLLMNYRSSLITIKEKLVESNIDFSFLRNENNNDIFKSIKAAETKFKDYDKIVVIGTGGSSLGAKAFLNIANKDRILFIENIDPNKLSNFIKKLYKIKFGIIIISKSGETLEVICLLDVLINYFKKTLHLQKDLLIITEKKKSILYDFAKTNKIHFVEHDPLIGGRFSFFSITGLLPIQLSGIDAKKIKLQADRNFYDNIANDKYHYNESVYILAGIVKEKKYVGHVFMVYIEEFKYLTNWYKQLWTESIGKNKYGLHLITAVGSNDQHSQLQMWLDGPDNLIYTLVIPKRRIVKFRTSNNKKNLPDYLQEKDMGNILNTMGEATVKELKEAKRPVRVIYLEDDSVYSAVTLMTTLLLEVSLIGKILKINPFNQPAVEKAKVRTRGLLN